MLLFCDGCCVAVLLFCRVVVFGVLLVCCVVVLVMCCLADCLFMGLFVWLRVCVCACL